MSYTISHRQVGVQRGNVTGLLQHHFRDVDKQNGKEVSHSNERIIAERTHLNESVMYVDGKPQEIDSVEQITDELDRRISRAGGTRTNKKTGEVKKIAVRKDAGVVRDMVLYLDPKFLGTSEEVLAGDENAESVESVRKHYEHMIEYYAELYGSQNLLASSLHFDETTPHMHLLVTPIDEQGRVRNASFIKDGRGNTSGLSKNDREMRAFMQMQGYDVDPEPTGVTRGRLSTDEYDRYVKEQDELAKGKVDNRVKEVELSGQEREIQQVKQQLGKDIAKLNKGQERLEHNEKVFSRKRKKLEERESSYKAQIDAEKDVEVKQLRDQVNEALRPLSAILTSLEAMRERMDEREKEELALKKEEASAAYKRAKRMFGLDEPEQQKPSPGNDFQMGG